ncbi:MAG TPA: TetR/AcrR family transcriptional regulator [Phycisphaerales bacterium]|nr:TetR/AcrR family transcriptional regulator [Phycisphaerales bacterium]
MPWKKNFDVDTARDRAKALFWSRGYQATSMDDLLKGMAINRGSFYATFGSKQDLYLDVLRRHEEHYRRGVLEHLRTAFAPREAILALFDAVRNEASGPKGTRGCFLANATMELASSDRTVAKIARGAFNETEAFFHAMIVAGRSDGAIPPTVDPVLAARALLGLLLGIRVLARGGSAPAVLDSIVQQVDGMI